MGKGNRDRRRARRKPFKAPKPVILIVSEGKVTEPEYLWSFKNTQKNPRVEIKTVPGIGVPMTIVESAKERKNEAERRARREKDENLRYDEVWCVFDIDQHPNVPDAKQMARDNGLKLAISNPCFELWLYLHFADQPGMKHRHDLQGMMKQHIPNYDKHVDYSDYEAGYDAAVQRATRLEEVSKADNDEGRNPTTGVWRLTESIRTDA